SKNFLFILGDVDLMIYAANRLTNPRQSTLEYRLTNEVTKVTPSIFDEIDEDDEDDVSPYDFM
ncbi:MAG TPA: hypothetical protein GX708_24235, partial [Gallicola sp.]|nr:hypothetical protein [Gallicola sp.]